jgi:hypothetical protein
MRESGRSNHRADRALIVNPMVRSCPPNALRISRRRGAPHKKAPKKPRSRAPKAVGLHAHVGWRFAAVSFSA